MDRFVHDDLVAVRDIGAPLAMAGIDNQTSNGWTEEMARDDLTKARRR